MMRPRRVDIRTSRKSNPLPEESPPRLRKIRTSRAHSSPPPRKISKKRVMPSKQRKIRQKKTRIIVSKPIARSPTPESAKLPEDPNELKPRRRKADAADYIKRRFLYGDDLTQKRSRTKAPTAYGRAINHGARSCSSTAALVAKSSANFMQRKRRRAKDENLSPNELPLIRSRRGRKPKQRDGFAFSPSHESVEAYSSTEEHDSAVDEPAYSDVIEDSPREYPQHGSELEPVQDSGDFLKPLFRKPKRSPYQSEKRFSPDDIQNPTDYMPDLPEFLLNDHMTDLTRTRGPVVLSKRARHRIMPRPTNSRSDFMKTLPDFIGREFNDFSMPESDEPFRHSKRSFALDQLVSVSETRRQPRDGVEWNSPTVVIGEEPTKPAPPRVDVEEFSGDLMHQRSFATAFTSSSGSSRRKSPVRPMQVLRNEPLIYHSESGGTPNVSSAGATLIQQTQIPQTIYCQPVSAGSGQTGLVELCAAAGLDSGVGGLPSTAELQTQPSQPTIISTPQAPQYSLVNSNIVSLQPGQMFLDVGVRPSVSGYTVSPAIAPVSRISVMSNRYSYGPSFRGTARLSQPQSATASSKSSGKPPPTNPAVRRRPSILKRGVTVLTTTPTPPSQPRKVAPFNRGARTLPLISPSVGPRLAPPFMRTAFRASLQAPLQHQRPLTYAIVSAATGAPMSSISPSLVRPQTASSRLFGPHRLDGQRPPLISAASVASVAGGSPSTALTLISCLPTSNAPVPTSQSGSSVRYTVVRGAADGKKYFLLGGSSVGVTGIKADALESLSTTAIEGSEQQEIGYEIESGFAADMDEDTSNSNFPPEHATTVSS